MRMTRDIHDVSNELKNIQEERSFTIEYYFGECVHTFFSSDRAKDMWDNVNQAELPISLTPWYIDTVIDKSSCLLVVSGNSNEPFTQDTPLAFFLFSLERKLIYSLCHLHRYDLFPEGVDIVFCRDADREQIAKNIIQWFIDRKIIIDLDGVSPHAAIVETIKRYFGYVKEENSVQGRRLDHFSGYEQFLKESSSKFRRKIRNVERNANVNGLTVRVTDKYDEDLIQSFFALHLGLFQSNSEIKNRLKEFHALIQQAGINDSLFITSIYEEDIPIAITLWFRNQDTYYVINTGRNANRKYKDVGFLLMIRGIEEVFSRSAQRIELMRPDSFLKQKMGGKPVEYIRLRCAPNRFLWIIYRASQELRNLFPNK